MLRSLFSFDIINYSFQNNRHVKVGYHVSFMGKNFQRQPHA